MAVPDTCSRIIKLSLSLLLLVFWSCVSEIQGPGEGELSIDNFVVDYDQVDTKLFLQFENTSEFEIDSAWVNMTVDETVLDTVFLLNDLGEDGDILPQNGIFSALINIELEYLKHKFVLNAISTAGQTAALTKTLNNTKLVPAEIENLYFYKWFEDGSSYKILDDTYYIDNTTTTYLNFQVQIKDPNGLENIQYVKYSFETFWTYAEGDSCECPGTNVQCNAESPKFYFNPDPFFSNDSTFSFDIFNEVIDVNEPLGFKISPNIHCNRFGVIKFLITVVDNDFGPSSKNFELLFTNCNEGIWNCEEECESCCEVCEDCEDCGE